MHRTLSNTTREHAHAQRRQRGRKTHDYPRNAVAWIAEFLQMLRHGNEDARRKGHVEDAVMLRPALLKLLQVFPEVDKRLVLVVLPGHVAAEIAEIRQLLLHLLGWRLDGRLDPLEVLLTIHLGPCIADDLDALGKKLVPVLSQAALGENSTGFLSVPKQEQN